VARRKDHYDSIGSELDSVNQFLSSKVESAKKHAMDLFSIKYQKSNLFDQLFKVAEEAIRVDTNHLHKK
jgi:hypothetical protein